MWVHLKGQRAHTEIVNCGGRAGIVWEDQEFDFRQVFEVSFRLVTSLPSIERWPYGLPT